MKKIITVSVALIILMCLSVALIGCKVPDEGKIRVANDNLYSDNGYIDYATEVFFDVDTYPDMAEMGLFWTRFDSETEQIIQVPADSAEGAALVDPAKPTIINVHGVLLDGYYQQERFYLNGKIANPAEFNLDTQNVSMLHIWLKEGWNVGTFHYNRFASEDGGPKIIEAKVWSTDAVNKITSETTGMRYRHQNGSYSAHNITEYSLAEHFAAEYIRAMNLLPDSMGSEEIRVAAHSMGGEVSTAGIFLLTELADDGQLSRDKLPDRFALLDSYFSTTLGTVYMGPVDITIRWSGKPLVNNNSGVTMLECLKDLEANGIALEYYTYLESFLKLGMVNIVEEFKTLTAYTIVYPNWNGNGYSVLTDGHNGVREWYLCSILSDPVKDITNGYDTTDTAPSAAMSTERIRELKGREYIVVDGTTTVNTADDTIITMYPIYYVLNGGNNKPLNVDYYTTLQSDIVLVAPTRSGYTFQGWYDNADFNGEAITVIATSSKSKIRLFAKWA